MDNRFYLQALGVTGLFIVLLLMFWVISGGPASEAEVRNANSTRTAIASTADFLLRPIPTHTPPTFILPTFSTPTGLPGSTLAPAATPTNTALFPQIATPIPSIAPSLAPAPSQTAIAQAPAIPRTGSHAQPTRAPRLVRQAESGVPGPAEFARWYFSRVWRERDYQYLWDNYLTASFKANVGSGLFEDYVGWWNSVERVDVNSVEVIENDGTDAWVRVDLTFHMKNGRVVSNQIYDYDFLYDANRQTWMFDAST